MFPKNVSVCFVVNYFDLLAPMIERSKYISHLASMWKVLQKYPFRDKRLEGGGGGGGGGGVRRL